MERNVPEELRINMPWICWLFQQDAPETKAIKLPINPHTGKLASVSNSATWGTFDLCYAVKHRVSGMGIVLLKELGYTCIDLDETDDPEEQARHQAIIKAFNSYTEYSQSGKGYHIWVRATVPVGRRRANVEMYCSGRYIATTGNVFLNIPIRECQELVNLLWAELGGKKNNEPVNEIGPHLNSEQTYSDYDILVMASTAVNGQKFMDIHDGNWQQYFPEEAHKEEGCNQADQALVNILAFYTQNREQIKRIFRASALGRRKKASREDYFENPSWGMLNKAFDKMHPPLDLAALRSNLEVQLQQQATVKQQATTVNLVGGMPLPPKHSPMPMQAQPDIAQAVNDQQLSLAPAVKPADAHSKSPKHATFDIYKKHNIENFEYTMPPGLLGTIARFIYQSAPRPVPEIAIAGAIGMLSGICGRSYNVSGTGLNTYTFLIAKTGRGKEAMQRGITKLFSHIVKTVPAVTSFMGPSKIASPEALTKYVAKTSQSFLSIMGEFADTLQKMSNVSGNPAQQGVRVAMLDLYNKSGHGDISGSLIYSDKDKNTDVITAPAFSVLGEATPDKFYTLTSKEMIDEGLLPRCTIIQYTGKRERLNKHHNDVVPSQQLTDQLSALCAYSLQLNNGNNVIQVQTDDEAQLMFDTFDTYCDDRINESDSMSAELWNRAHIKSLKLAALLAVGVNYINPVINAECATWALKLINQDVNTMLHKFENGEVGAVNFQNEQTVEIKKAFKKYVKSTWEEVAKMTGSSLQTHTLKIVPHSFISGFCRQRTCFKNDRLGPVNGIKVALQSLVDCGEIVELSVIDKRKALLSTSARLYMVSDMKL